jgi:putative tryptophan/tyrosine transport system substrate-binding protein
MIRRRDFITLLGGAMAAAWPLAGRAQQPTVPVVGLLQGADYDDPILTAALRLGLSQSGFVEGKSVTIEYRDAHGQYDRLPALADELVRRQVAVIGTVTPIAALAAKAATTAIPIVFTLGSDPVKDGLVASLNQPGGNVTGVTFFSNLLDAKRLVLLHEAVPTAAPIAILLNPNNSNAVFELNDIETAARRLGLQLFVVRASNEREIDAAFATLVQQRATALLVFADQYFSSRRGQIVLLATRHAIATSFSVRDSVVAGGLMSYGANLPTAYRQAGIYIARILKGEKPADLPVIQPTRFDLVLNLNTAKTLGIEIPLKILALADEVIE